MELSVSQASYFTLYFITSTNMELYFNGNLTDFHEYLENQKFVHLSVKNDTDEKIRQMQETEEADFTGPDGELDR